MNRQFTELIISCIPFFIIVILWIVIARWFRKANKANKANYDNKYIEMKNLLSEIRDELKELNKNNSQKQ